MKVSSCETLNLSLCCFVFRSVSAGFEESMNLKGITVYRYTLQPETLASPTVNPENQCFCRNPKTTKNCTSAGVLDISSCQNGQCSFVDLSTTYPESKGGWCIPVLSSAVLPFCSAAWHFKSPFFPCHVNRKTYLHLSAPLPSWKSIPARGCAWTQSQWGAPCHLPRCGTSKRLFIFVISYFEWQLLWCTFFVVFSHQTTGFTLRFAKRIQVNMMYGPSKVIT